MKQKRIVRLTESEFNRMIKNVINEVNRGYGVKFVRDDFNMNDPISGIVRYDDDDDVRDSYRIIGEYSNGCAMVQHKTNHNFNFINRKGNLISREWFLEAQEFKNGFAAVMIEGMWHFINTNGKLLKCFIEDENGVIKRQNEGFSMISDFNSDGTAKVEDIHGRAYLLHDDGELEKITDRQSIEDVLDAEYGDNDVDIEEREEIEEDDDIDELPESKHSINSALSETKLNRIIKKTLREATISYDDEEGITSFEGTYSAEDENGNVSFIDKKSLYRNIPGAYFIWHGEYSDPEIYYEKKFLNYYKVEQYLFDEYKAYCEEYNEKETEEGFEDWLEEQGKDFIIDVLDLALNGWTY